MPLTARHSRAARRLFRVALVLGIVLGTLALYTRREAIRLADTNPPSGQLTMVRGVRLHYIREGSGPPVLLVHGMPGFLQDWQLATQDQTSVFDDLARDHTVIAIDRPGYGWSGLPDGDTVTLEEQADLVAGLLDNLGVDRITFVGHSYGGALGLAFTVRHPERVAGLVHVAGVGYPEHTEPWVIERMLVAPLAGELLRYCLAPVILPGQVEAGLAEVFAPDAPHPEHTLLFTRFLARARTLEQYGTEARTMQASAVALSPQYPNITIPVTILLGDAEPLPPVQYSAKQLAHDLPDARFVEIPNTGHMVPHTRPHVVTEEVRRLTRQSAMSDPAPTE